MLTVRAHITRINFKTGHYVHIYWESNPDLIKEALRIFDRAP